MHKILHVTDCLNAGVYEALVETIKESPFFEHHLLFESRINEVQPSLTIFHELATPLYSWKGTLIEKNRKLREIVGEVSPEIIHLHSSMAGVLGRIGNRRIKKIYSSHGFGFQKKDINFITRCAIFMIEKLLQLNTFKYIAYMPYEFWICNNFFSRKKTYLASSSLWNIDNLIDESENSILNDPKNVKQVISIGRLTKAKDPDFFIEVCASLTEKGYKGRFIWIGDGLQKYKNSLIQNKIEVTGWLTQSEIDIILSHTNVAVLTSSWDSGPSVLFRIINNQIPIVLRNFNAAKFLPLQTLSTPDKMANNILKILGNEKITAKNQFKDLKFFLNHLPSHPLNHIYREIVSS
jgi:glycosyltransferase involved in cell wall biosynthesis